MNEFDEAVAEAAARHVAYLLSHYEIKSTWDMTALVYRPTGGIIATYTSATMSQIFLDLTKHNLSMEASH